MATLIRVVPFPAYRLKKCPPPPGVENAEMIYEDDDFQIGKQRIHSAFPSSERCVPSPTMDNSNSDATTVTPNEKCTLPS